MHRDYGVDQLAQAHPSVPWVQVAAFRNILAHKYLGVDITLVWEIIVRDLPALENAINIVVDALNGR